MYNDYNSNQGGVKRMANRTVLVKDKDLLIEKIVEKRIFLQTTGKGIKYKSNINKFTH